MHRNESNKCFPAQHVHGDRIAVAAAETDGHDSSASERPNAPSGRLLTQQAVEARADAHLSKLSTVAPATNISQCWKKVWDFANTSMFQKTSHAGTLCAKNVISLRKRDAHVTRMIKAISRIFSK